MTNARYQNIYLDNTLCCGKAGTCTSSLTAAKPYFPQLRELTDHHD